MLSHTKNYWQSAESNSRPCWKQFTKLAGNLLLSLGHKALLANQNRWSDTTYLDLFMVIQIMADSKRDSNLIIGLMANYE